MAIDARLLRSLIRDAARNAFDELRQAHPEETFYAFALYVDDRLMKMMPAANSEEDFAKVSRQHHHDYLARARWSIAEWANKGMGEDHFQPVYDLLNSDSRDPTRTGKQFDALGSKVIAGMVGALQDLDVDGFFGTGSQRAKVTLFVSISDSSQSRELEDESARHLNPAGVPEAFIGRFE
jgi:hypothetical protein